MKNTYGLDADYFNRLFARELTPDVVRNQTPTCLARVLLRAARTASEQVFSELEFSGLFPKPAEELAGITLTAEGEANTYRMMRGGNWLASLRMNGELLVSQQEAILSAMLASPPTDHSANNLDMVKALAAALDGVLSITQDSAGVAGYHLNGEIADWLSFPEVVTAWDVLAMYRERTADQPAAAAQNLPHWEPCNPGCDPEFNGSRSRHCATLCHNAREALAAAPAPVQQHGMTKDGLTFMGEPLVQPYEAPREKVNALFKALGLSGTAPVGDILDAALARIEAQQPAVVPDALRQFTYVTSESGPRGFKLTLGFESLNHLQAARAALAAATAPVQQRGMTKDGLTFMGEPLVQPYEAPREKVNALFKALGFSGTAPVGDILDAALARIEAQQQGVPDGWKLVPVEPTEAIRDAMYTSGFESDDSILNYAYKAMLAAAPAPVQQPAVCMGCVEQASRIRELEHKMDYYTTAPVAEPASQTAAARDVLAERQRQISAEGWTPEHDDEHSQGQLPAAAASYAIDACGIALGHDSNAAPPAFWPWHPSWWKPSGARRNLVKAGALILAEIERIDRAAAPSAEGGAE